MVTVKRHKSRHVSASSSTWRSDLLTCTLLLLLLLSHGCVPHFHVVVVASICGIGVLFTSSRCSRLLGTGATLKIGLLLSM
jgi:hypothetical protein